MSLTAPFLLLLLRQSVLAFTVLAALLGFQALGAGPLPAGQFVNPIGEGADPWVTWDESGNRYLWCQSEGNRAIAILHAPELTRLGRKQVIWQAPDEVPFSQEVWAPELHRIGNRWYVYFAASDGRNVNHLAYVLASDSSDPLGPYTLHGPMATGDGQDGLSPNVWAIDMTPLQAGDRLYAIWSGWDAPGTDRQFLYIAPMSSPTQLSGPRVRIASNDDYPWEITEPGSRGRGLAEGPQVLQHQGRTFVLYSCGASWLSTYKLGMLELVGKDPLDPVSWRKSAVPVFQSNQQTWGVGHSCLVSSPDGREWWHVFHAKQDQDPGWRRALFVQPAQFDEQGMPLLGEPVAAGQALSLPSGQKTVPFDLPFRNGLRSGADEEAFAYYGHHQYILWSDEGLHLGKLPRKPINAFRTGEKVMLQGELPPDVSVDVEIDFQARRDALDAGILFRTSGPALGYDGQRGYFAGLIPRTGLVILGMMDGKRWKELARAETPIPVLEPQRLRVEAQGNEIRILHNGKERIRLNHSAYVQGGVGLRVVNTHALFRNLSVKAVKP